MKTAPVFSIGLNVDGAEPAGQLARTLRLATYAGALHDVALIRGTWEGKPERTLQAALSPYISAVNAAIGMARMLRQECIALLHPGADSWRLVYADGRTEPGGDLKAFPLHVNPSIGA